MKIVSDKEYMEKMCKNCKNKKSNFRCTYFTSPA